MSGADNTERFKKIAEEAAGEAAKGERAGWLQQFRPWATAVVMLFLGMFSVCGWLATRASAQDLEEEIRARMKVQADVDMLKAARLFDDQRLNWLGEQLVEVARATHAPLIPQPGPPAPISPTEIMPALPQLQRPHPAR